MVILSRKDRLSPARPTAKRALILTGALFAMMLLSNALLSYTHRAESVLGAPKGENEVQLTFVGDVCLGRYVAKYGERVGYASIFAQSENLWQNSDAVFANLECVILDDTQNYTKNPNKVIWLPAAKAALEAAYSSGIHAVSLANNHTVDFGRDGIETELELMDALGMDYFGAGKNQEAASSCKYYNFNGISVGVLGVCTISPEGTYTDDYTISSAANTNLYHSIFEASRQADLVIVYAHWGTEYSQLPSDVQRTLAHRLIESGADIVIGSHPHILQNMEQYRDGLIFYSIGNYIFDQGTRETRNSVVVQMNMNPSSGNAELVLIPIRIDDFTPHATTSSYYIREIQNTLLEGLPQERYSVTEDGRIHIPFSVNLTKEQSTQ